MVIEGNSAGNRAAPRWRVVAVVHGGWPDTGGRVSFPHSSSGVCGDGDGRGGCVSGSRRGETLVMGVCHSGDGSVVVVLRVGEGG
ncbi:pollen-specific leucine-rich repeat extensin-like protein 4 [Iris pallida]|uniref:Pollen-specific leucine-rich repeat extensin-like protein 4 n=1 Tax=Iris pallida TaxID=29817 RepID=A0AAX6F3C9_IRIPA|nr:pollen-specific leucine-rich repeat extensin-like protein 4 [Iris pallida]KAJ6849977.1 pollen-specific leucine-rich repeat extensin-like protein 4 [Iris pallida]